MLAVSQLKSPERSSSMAVLEERRDTTRLDCDVPVTVRGTGCPEDVHCTARDLSEGGLFMYMPPGRALAVGNRCELVLAEAGRIPELTAWAGVPVYATVIRTEAVPSDAPHLGVGLRFDQPLLL
jgi:hypothetical protein